MKFKDILMKVHAARSASQDPILKHAFRVTIPGIPGDIGFVTCSELSETAEVTEYREGGYGPTHKLPGIVSVPEITLTRGEYSSTALKDYVENSLTNPNFRETVIIEHLDRFGATQRTYKLAEAWASGWTSSDMDASSSDVAIETLTLQFENYL